VPEAKAIDPTPLAALATGPGGLTHTAHCSARPLNVPEARAQRPRRSSSGTNGTNLCQSSAECGHGGAALKRRGVQSRRPPPRR
jgi:hypothetical protein